MKERAEVAEIGSKLFDEIAARVPARIGKKAIRAAVERPDIDIDAVFLEQLLVLRHIGLHADKDRRDAGQADGDALGALGEGVAGAEQCRGQRQYCSGVPSSRIKVSRARSRLEEANTSGLTISSIKRLNSASVK